MKCKIDLYASIGILVSILMIMVGILGYIFVYLPMHDMGDMDAMVGTVLLVIAFGGMFLLCLSALTSRLYYAFIKKTMSKYDHIPAMQINDYAEELQKMRNQFHADTSAKKNLPKSPVYPGSENCYDYSVVQNGEVYYACIVQANERLFVRDPWELASGMVVIYSLDPYYAKNPLELCKIAEAIYEDEESNILDDEYAYFSNLDVDKKLTEGRQVYITTSILYRRHLPTGYLSDRVFPLIANPAASKTCLALESKYWTEAAISQFVHGHFSWLSREKEWKIPDEWVEFF